jgi:hypothetical protein
MTFAIRMSGGLGNQLFQLCFAYSLHSSSSEKILLDLGKCTTDTATAISPLVFLPNDAYEIADFIEKNPILSFLRKNSKSKNSMLTSTSSKTNVQQKLTIMNENYRQFVPSFLKLDEAYFIGTFASHKYWHLGFDSTIQWLTENIFKAVINTSDFAIYDLAVHARRGDYISNPKTRSFHGYCDIAYFDKAFRLIKSRDSSINSVLVSSDDSSFALELRITASQYFSEVHILEEDSALKAILQLSKCKSFIGSNSTFSWWAGYLSPKDFRIFPSDWYLSQRMTFSKELLFPSKPILIENALMQ